MRKRLKGVRGKWSGLLLLALSLCSSAVPTAAQPVPTLSSEHRAEVVERKVTEEAETALKKLPEEKVELPEPQKREAPPPSADIEFTVSKIVLEGNTRVPTEDLERLIAPFENRTVRLRDIDLLSKHIEEVYRGRGFLTAYVYIPPQRLEEGRVRIRIVEGKVGSFQVEGNRFFRKKRILSYVRLKSGEVLKYQNLRKDLERLNENSDRRVRAILREGRVPETTDIIFKVKDQFPLHPGFSYDNQGTRTIGRQRFGFWLRANNLTSLDDVFSVGTVFGKNFGVLYLQHLLPIPQIDARVVSGFSHAQVSAKRDLEPFGVNGTSQTYFSRLEKVFHRGEHWSFGVSGGFEFKESRTKVLSGTFQRNRLRILRIGPVFRQQDRWGASGMKHDFVVGLDWLGAAVFTDPGAVRQGVTPRFFYYRGSAHRVQKLFAGSQAKIRLEWQIPDGKLPAQEQFYLGGATSVRGYPEGDYLADLGLLWGVEYLIPFFLLPEEWKWPGENESLRERIHLFTFLDEGYGRLRGASERESASRHLLGVGGGIQVKIHRNLLGRVAWGYGLGDQPITEGRRNQFHFSLQAEV